MLKIGRISCIIEKGSRKQEDFLKKMIFGKKNIDKEKVGDFFDRLIKVKGNIVIGFKKIDAQMQYRGGGLGEKSLCVSSDFVQDYMGNYEKIITSPLLKFLGESIFYHELLHVIQDNEKITGLNVIQPSARATIAFLQELEAHRFSENVCPYSKLGERLGDPKTLLRNYEKQFQVRAKEPGYKLPRDPDEVYAEYARRLNIPMEEIKEIEAGFSRQYPDYKVQTEGNTTVYQGADRKICVTKTQAGTVVEATYTPDIKNAMGAGNDYFPLAERRVFDANGILKQTDVLLNTGERWILNYQSDFELVSTIYVTDSEMVRELVCDNPEEVLVETWNDNGYTLATKKRVEEKGGNDKVSKGQPNSELKICLYGGRKHVARYDETGKIIPPPRPEVGKHFMSAQSDNGGPGPNTR